MTPDCRNSFFDNRGQKETTEEIEAAKKTCIFLGGKDEYGQKVKEIK